MRLTMMARLTREERGIVEAFERDELRSPRNKSAIMKRHREYAAATLRKDRRVPVAPSRSGTPGCS